MRWWLSKWTIAVCTVAIAGYLGGPTTFAGPRLNSLVGACPIDPPPPNCNTNGLNATNCGVLDGQSCSQQYQKCKPANSGIQQTKICDPGTGTLQCQASGCVALNQDQLGTNCCTKYTPP
jgi:hypothetical protein